ncbi:MAG: ABC-F family ATP-binding cassette domain-containing protein [bacterium]|nr:ABC-F family ATP-binding cassette domain-containing protein [bacterium]
MSLLIASQLSKFYGPDEIFDNITVEIPHKSRIALVGPNGAGKTTLLNILAGMDTPTTGVVTTAKGITIGFLPQRPELAGEHSLYEEQLRAFDHLRKMEAQLSQLEHDLADPTKHDQTIKEYGALQEKFERLGGYTYVNRIRTVLHGVGFDEADYGLSLAVLSGGQKTRALLGRLLLTSPDLLILDEPTNHLDINAVEWLEGFLKEFEGAVLAVSHDRYFMDNFATSIWELDYGALETYRGNYSHYVSQRTERHERLIKEYEAQQEFIAKEQDFIRKHMGSQLTAQAKGRQKKLETMRRRGKIIGKPRGERKDMSLRLQSAIRSGDKVLMAKNLAVGYSDAPAPLFTIPELTLYRGETAALIGANGVGKSTFLKTVIEHLPPLGGDVTLGASVKVGYFAQAHERLNPKNTLVDEIVETKYMPVSEARSYLGSFLFTGDDSFRTVDTLSGGERGRLALAKLALSGANLLLLDEPTNHLDIDSQEVLQEVLSQFDGTILLVSHDRYLIDALASQIWEAQAGKMTIFNGTYREFVATRNNLANSVTSDKPATNGKSTPAPKPTPTKKAHGLNPFQLKKRIEAVESHILALEKKVEELHSAIGDASAKGDAKAVSDLGAQYMQAEADLETAMGEWEVLME